MGCNAIRVLPSVSHLLFNPLPQLTLFTRRLRQYPLYSKTSPPEVLAGHFKDDAFQKSQNYGRDKAKFSLVTGLFKQAIDSALLHYGLYASAWDIGGKVIAYFGYGSEYEVRGSLLSTRALKLTKLRFCNPLHFLSCFSLSRLYLRYLSLHTKHSFWKRNTGSTRLLPPYSSQIS